MAFWVAIERTGLVASEHHFLYDCTAVQKAGFFDAELVHSTAI
jgi:hypothetical protein